MEPTQIPLLPGRLEKPLKASPVSCPFCGQTTTRKGSRKYAYVGRNMIRYYCDGNSGCRKYHLRDPETGIVFDQSQSPHNKGHRDEKVRIIPKGLDLSDVQIHNQGTQTRQRKSRPVRQAIPNIDFKKSLEQFTSSSEYISEGNAYLVFVMSLWLDEPSSPTIASECLTDGYDDKKIDFIKLDRDNKRIILAQGYFSHRSSPAAPANKASDLNVASAWLFSGDAALIPANLRSVILECRSAMEEGDIEEIQLLYVHNLPESANVKNELETAATHLQSTVSSSSISVLSKEIGRSSAERLFIAHQSPIAVQSEIECPGTAIYSEDGPTWMGYVLSVPGSWLHELYRTYGDEIFSANYRGFLGISKRKKINSGIRQSAESDPNNFWVYNNGITILTQDIHFRNGTSVLSGISIINGAQTTGSISTIDTAKFQLDAIRVLTRIIKCSDLDTIANIIKFNNTQNDIKNWDQYSNDPEQIRIESEFRELGHTYSRKRGFSKSSNADIGIEDISTSLVAFQGRFADANRGKNHIFERKDLCQLAFDGRTAMHILFVATLAASIDQIRLLLKDRSNTGDIIDQERRQLELLRNLRFKNFLIAVIADCVETILARPINRSSVAFTKQAAHANNHSINDLSQKWVPVVRAVLALVAAEIGRDESLNDFTQENAAEGVSKRVAAMLYGQANPALDSFKEVVAT